MDIQDNLTFIESVSHQNYQMKIQHPNWTKNHPVYTRDHTIAIAWFGWSFDSGRFGAKCAAALHWPAEAESRVWVVLSWVVGVRSVGRPNGAAIINWLMVLMYTQILMVARVSCIIILHDCAGVSVRQLVKERDAFAACNNDRMRASWICDWWIVCSDSNPPLPHRSAHRSHCDCKLQLQPACTMRRTDKCVKHRTVVKH